MAPLSSRRLVLRSLRTWLLTLITGVLAQGGASLSPGAPAAEKPLVINPRDRVMVLRAFVPLEGRRRLHACLVGTPAGVHFAYDFDTGMPFLVWRGAFADMSGMWIGAGLDQVARPAVPATLLPVKPALAFLPGHLFTLPSGWPEQPEALYRSLGYELERNGQPVFLASLEALRIRDRIAPSADGRGLDRCLVFSGRLSPWETWLLVGEAGGIVADDEGWAAENGAWRIHWPVNAGSRPVVHTGTGNRNQQLVLRLEAVHLAEPVCYTLHWQ